MTDIVEALKERRYCVDGSLIFVEIREQLLDDAIQEIKRLRKEIEALETDLETIGYDRRERT